MTDEKLRRAMQVCPSGVTFSPARREAVLRAVKGAQSQTVHRKVSYTLVLAVVLALLMTGGAVAAGLGLFGQFASQEGSSAPQYELDHLEEYATVYDAVLTPATQSTAAPAAEAETDYDRLMAMHERLASGFTVTLNQAYCDGERLSFSYTLELQEVGWMRGEGLPTGVDFTGGWHEDKSLLETCCWKYQSEWGPVDERALYKDEWIIPVDEPYLRTRIEWLDAHDSSWIADTSAGNGDGVDLADGTYLTPIEGDRTRVSDTLVKGFYTVRMPEGYKTGDELTFYFRAGVYTSIYYQDSEGFSRVSVAETSADYPFTITVGGSLVGLHGEAAFDQYAAEARISLSQVTVTGQVTLDVPAGWTANFGQNDDRGPEEDHILTYQLVAAGQALHNYDNSLRLTEDGRLVIGIQCDIPYSGVALYLRPVYSISGPHPDEDILLIPDKR